MAVSFADQVIAFLANAANQSQFAATVGLQPFAVTSFTRRYGQRGFQINGVTLGAPSDFRLQEFLSDASRVAGFREKRSEQPERYWYDQRIWPGNTGWVDAVITVPVQFALQAVPGSIQLGPGASVTPAGVSDPAPLIHQLNFQLAVDTNAFSASYNAGVYVFATAEPSPVADLRQILGLRRLLESNGNFLASLDGSSGQRPYLFVQLYPSGSLTSPPLSEAAVVSAFAAADVLAVFLTIPNM